MEHSVFMNFARMISSFRTTLERLDLLTLRNPERRYGLLTRFETLRQSLRKMGFHPEALDGFQTRGKTLNLLEKVLVMGAVYCGLDYDRVFQLLAEPCGLIEERVTTLASRARRSLGSADDFLGPAVQMLLNGSRQTVTDLSPERTLHEIAGLAQGDLGDICSWDESGRLSFTPSDLLTRQQRALVSEIAVTQGRGGEVTTKVKLHDKLKALELLAKHQGLLTEKVEVSVDISIADRLEKARSRVLEGQLDHDERSRRRVLTYDAGSPQGVSALPATALDSARSRAGLSERLTDRSAVDHDLPELSERAED